MSKIDEALAHQGSDMRGIRQYGADDTVIERSATLGASRANSKDTVLITGGAGSLGRILVDKFVNAGYTVRVLDNHEESLVNLDYDKLTVRKIYGDICDYRTVHDATRGAGIVIHAAAMKNLNITEYNIERMIDVNINGTANVARAAHECRCKTAIFISSDKSVEPTTSYGCSKQMGERIWRWRRDLNRGTVFRVMRSGNFTESSGNVFEIWGKQYKNNQPLTITDASMKRYFIPTDKAADIIIKMCSQTPSSQDFIVIPAMKSHSIVDLLNQKYPTSYLSPYGARSNTSPTIKITGRRPGEKLTEKLVADDEVVLSSDDTIMVIA